MLLAPRLVARAALPLALLLATGNVLAAQRADSTARRDRHEIFGGGLLFPSLVASLNEPSLRNSLLVTRGPDPYRTLIGLTEQGATISLYRYNGARGDDGVELSIQGSTSAQFDLLGSRWTLLDADYVFSYPITWRRGTSALRLRPYHRSSHLGDRYLFRRDARTFDSTGFRKEAYELLYARSLGDSVRSGVLFAGGEYAYSVTPRDMRRVQLRAGGDVTRRFHEFGSTARASWVAGTELVSFEERGWNVGISARTGVEIGRLAHELPGGRRYRALVEYYAGPSTYGHFSRQDTIHSIGVACIVIP